MACSKPPMVAYKPVGEPWELLCKHLTSDEGREQLWGLESMENPETNTSQIWNDDVIKHVEGELERVLGSYKCLLFLWRARVQFLIG